MTREEVNRWKIKYGRCFSYYSAYYLQQSLT